MLEKDKVLKTLVAIATFLVLFSLAVLAILNFAGGENQASKKNETTTSSTSSKRETRATTTKTQTTTVTTKSTTSEAITTLTPNPQAPAELDSPPASNANEDRGERTPLITQAAQTTQAAVTEAQTPQRHASQIFKSQAEAHAYGNDEAVRIGRQGQYRANYEIATVRDAQGNVTGYETNIYVRPRN